MVTETSREPPPSVSTEHHSVDGVAPQPVGIVVFEVDGVRYGVVARHVREILPAVPPVPLPGGPEIVWGVMNLRGQVVPVVDLRARLRLSRKEIGLTDHMIVASAGAQLVVLPTDRVIEVVEVEPAHIEGAITVAAVRPFAGVAKLSDGLVVIHDLDSFLSREETDQLQDALVGRSHTGH